MEFRKRTTERGNHKPTRVDVLEAYSASNDDIHQEGLKISGVNNMTIYPGLTRFTINFGFQVELLMAESGSVMGAI